MLYTLHGHRALATEGVCLSFQRQDRGLRLYQGPGGLRRIRPRGQEERFVPPDHVEMQKLLWPDHREQWSAPFDFVDAEGQPNGCAELAILFGECAGYRMEIIQGTGANGVLYRLFGAKSQGFREKDGRPTSLQAGYRMQFNLAQHALVIIDGQDRRVKWANGTYERRVDWMDLTEIRHRDFLVKTILAGTELHPQRLRSDTEQCTHLLLSPGDAGVS